MIDPTLQTVMLGTAAIGAAAGLIGAFAVVRRQSLQGDAISHAALPGVAVAFFLGGRTAEAIAFGAAAAGWIAMLAVAGIVRRSRLSFDVALGGTLAVFFGLGLTLMEYIKRHVKGSTQHGLERYLFGQAATLRDTDLHSVLIVGAVIVLVLVLFWKQFQTISFDADYAHSLGIPVRLFDALLSALLVAAVVIGLQAVGVVLMSALIVAPAVAARQWTNRLARLVLFSAFFGAISGVAGTLLSHYLTRPNATVPTGPTIVLCATAVVVLSLLAAPQRGLLWRRRGT